MNSLQYGFSYISLYQVPRIDPILENSIVPRITRCVGPDRYFVSIILQDTIYASYLKSKYNSPVRTYLLGIRTQYRAAIVCPRI